MTLKTWQQKHEEATELGKQAKALLSNPDATQEEKNKVPQMIEDMNR